VAAVTVWDKFRVAMIFKRRQFQFTISSSIAVCYNEALIRCFIGSTKNISNASEAFSAKNKVPRARENHDICCGIDR